MLLPPPLSLHSLFATEMLQMLCAPGHGQWDGIGWDGIQWRSPPWWGLCSALFAGCAHNRSPAGTAQWFPLCSVWKTILCTHRELARRELCSRYREVWDQGLFFSTAGTRARASSFLQVWMVPSGALSSCSGHSLQTQISLPGKGTRSCLHFRADSFGTGEIHPGFPAAEQGWHTSPLDSLQQVILVQFFLCWGPRAERSSPDWVSQGQTRGGQPLPHPADTPLLVQPRMQLTFRAVSAHCWLTTSFSSTRNPMSFLAEQLSVSSPNLLSIWDCPDPSATPCLWPC